MTIDELRQTIQQRTGVPASLLTGETSEEVVARAKALLALKKESEVQRPKTTREQFGAWFNATQGMEAQDTESAALAEIEEAARREAGGYPILQDGGEIDTSAMPDPRPAREQFAEWFKNKTAFNPFKGEDGWTKLF